MARTTFIGVLVLFLVAFHIVPIGNVWAQAPGTASCTYTPDEDGWETPHAATYGLFVRTRDGRIEQVATWRSLPGKTMQLAAATAVSRKNIASVEVRTADGTSVLKLSA